MKKKHADNFFKHGELRIGTLYDFRNEEKHGSEIGDKDEGTKTLTTDGYHFIDTADSSTIPSWYAKGFNDSFKLVDAARLQIHARDGVRVRLTIPDRYVFCMSDDYDSGLIENGGYSACIRIHNPGDFFAALSKEMRRKANWLGWGKCRYRPRLILGDHDDELEPALIKEERYSYQKEVRAIWAARQDNQDNIEPFILKVKKARYYCELICA